VIILLKNLRILFTQKSEYFCNPSYAGSRDQEDHCSKPSQANSLQEPILKNPSQKRAGGMIPDVDPELKPQYYKKKVCMYIYEHDTDCVMNMHNYYA
jgi:hypothetical protein